MSSLQNMEHARMTKLIKESTHTGDGKRHNSYICPDG